MITGASGFSSDRLQWLPKLSAMSETDTHTQTLMRQAERLLTRVLTRDDLYLLPKTLSQAAAKRARRGLRQLEAYLRRVLIVLALKMEPDLVPGTRPLIKIHRAKKQATSAPGLRIFDAQTPSPEWDTLKDRSRRKSDIDSCVVPAAPFLDRLVALKAIIDAPEARAKRLALHMARRRPGWLLAPDFGRKLLPANVGT